MTTTADTVTPPADTARVHLVPALPAVPAAASYDAALWRRAFDGAGIKGITVGDDGIPTVDRPGEAVSTLFAAVMVAHLDAQGAAASLRAIGGRVQRLAVDPLRTHAVATAGRVAQDLDRIADTLTRQPNPNGGSMTSPINATLVAEALAAKILRDAMGNTSTDAARLAELVADGALRLPVDLHHAIAEIVGYNWADEEADYEANPCDQHIFMHLQRVDAWLQAHVATPDATDEPAPSAGEGGADRLAFLSIAGEHLTRQGFRVLDSLHRSRYGVLDLVVIDDSDSTVVFVTVKGRRQSANGHRDTVPSPPRTWRSVRGMASVWLVNTVNRPRGTDLRFDIISVTVDTDDNVVAIDHREAAF